MDPAEWDRVLRVNLSGVVWCLPGGRRRHDRTQVPEASSRSRPAWRTRAGRERQAYAASKAALIAFAKSAAKEIAQHRVRFKT